MAVEIIMTSLLVSALALAGPVQDRLITFSAPAAPASVVLAQLSSKLGYTLATTPETENEILVIQVADVKEQDLLDQIAKVTDAEWQPGGNGSWLKRSKERALQAESEELAARKAIAQSLLKALAERQAKFAAWSVAEAERLAKGQKQFFESLERGSVIRTSTSAMEIAEGSPGDRVLGKLLSRVGAETLARIKAGERVVLATRPTAMQRPLPLGSSDDVNAFVQQQREFAAAVGTSAPDNGERRVTIFQGINGPNLGDGDFSLGAGQSILVLTREGESIRAQLTVADKKGATLTNASITLVPPVVRPEAEGDEIVLDEMGKEFVSHARARLGAGGRVTRTMIRLAVTTDPGGSGGSPQTFTFDGSQPRAQTEVSTELRRRLLKPTEFDPVAIVPGTAFGIAAKKSNRNLVACLPDGSIMALTNDFGGGKVTVAGLLGPQGKRAGVTVEASQKWLVAKPTYPVTARRDRMARQALEAFYTSVAREGYASLAEMTKLAQAQAKPVNGREYDGAVLNLIDPGAAGPALEAFAQANTMRLLGSLTPNQRAQLGNGTPLTVAQLSPGQREFLYAEIFQETGFQMPLSNPRLDGLPDGIAAERTQVLPQGLAPQATVALQFSERTTAFATDGRSGASSVVTPERLASSMFMMEQPQLAMFGEAPRYDVFQPARQVQYDFTFTLAPEVIHGVSLSDTWIDRKAPRAGYSSLPEEFRDRADRALEAMKKSFSGITIGGAGQKPPPADPS